MNTLELAFYKWFYEQSFVNGVTFKEPEMRAAFDAGYLAGFDHAKRSAIGAMAVTLQKLPPND